MKWRSMSKARARNARKRRRKNAVRKAVYRLKTTKDTCEKVEIIGDFLLYYTALTVAICIDLLCVISAFAFYSGIIDFILVAAVIACTALLITSKGDFIHDYN